MTIDRVLVAYASKTNVTAENADLIWRILLERFFFDADLKDVRSARYYPHDYDAFVVGSGVRMNRWYGPARKLLKHKELKRKPVAIFVSCGLMTEPGKRMEAEERYLDAVASKYGIEPIAKAAFAGRYPKETEVDHTDPEQVRKWAVELGELLKTLD